MNENNNGKNNGKSAKENNSKSSPLKFLKVCVWLIMLGLCRSGAHMLNYAYPRAWFDAGRCHLVSGVYIDLRARDIGLFGFRNLMLRVIVSTVGCGKTVQMRVFPTGHAMHTASGRSAGSVSAQPGASTKWASQVTSGTSKLPWGLHGGCICTWTLHGGCISTWTCTAFQFHLDSHITCIHSHSWRCHAMAIVPHVCRFVLAHVIGPHRNMKAVGCEPQSLDCTLLSVIVETYRAISPRLVLNHT